MATNEFALRDEIIFIEYKEVIKTPYPKLLEIISKDYRGELDGAIDFSLIDTDRNSLNNLCRSRVHENVLDQISLVKFDSYQVLKALEDNYKELYMDSELLSIGETVYKLMQHKSVKKIYIWHPTNDDRVKFDIMENFHTSNKVMYIAGDFKDCINSIENITTYILANVDNVENIIESDKQKFTEIMVAEYGFNYTISDTDTMSIRGNYEELMGSKLFKIASFNPIK